MQTLSLAMVRPLPSPVPQEIVDLGDTALTIGYKPLARRVQAISAFHQGAMLLKGIGIGVYDYKSVDRYKAIALLKAKWLMHIRYFISAAVLVPLTFVYARLCYAAYKSHSPLEALFGISAIVTGAAGIVCLIVYIAKTLDSNRILEWHADSLESYDKPMPEDIILKAIAIRDELPKSELYVEELRSRKRVIDPFLYVVYKGVRLYVGVWNEPKFNGRML